MRPKDEIELLQFEATVTDLVADRIEAFRGIAERIRVMGSLALSLCHLAAGRVDAVCSLKPARSVDIAAAQLLIRECGLAVDLPEARPSSRRRSISRGVQIVAREHRSVPPHHRRAPSLKPARSLTLKRPLARRDSFRITTRFWHNRGLTPVFRFLFMEGRSRIVAAGTQEACRRIADALLR